VGRGISVRWWGIILVKKETRRYKEKRRERRREKKRDECVNKKEQVHGRTNVRLAVEGGRIKRVRGKWLQWQKKVVCEDQGYLTHREIIRRCRKRNGESGSFQSEGVSFFFSPWPLLPSIIPLRNTKRNIQRTTTMEYLFRPVFLFAADKLTPESGQ